MACCKWCGDSCGVGGTSVEWRVGQRVGVHPSPRHPVCRLLCPSAGPNWGDSEVGPLSAAGLGPSKTVPSRKKERARGPAAAADTDALVVRCGPSPWRRIGETLGHQDSRSTAPLEKATGERLLCGETVERLEGGWPRTGQPQGTGSGSFLFGTFGRRGPERRAGRVYASEVGLRKPSFHLGSLALWRLDGGLLSGKELEKVTVCTTLLSAT